MNQILLSKKVTFVYTLFFSVVFLAVVILVVSLVVDVVRQNRLEKRVADLVKEELIFNKYLIDTEKSNAHAERTN